MASDHPRSDHDWVVLFFVQAYLGATGRIAQHRRVGNFGFALGWLALLSMMFVHFRGLATHPLPEDKRIYDWLLPFLYVYFSFSAFLVWAYRKRAQPAWHKRLITFALFISLEAAVQRLQWLPSGHGFWPLAGFLDGCLLIPLITFDAITLKWRLHPATTRASLVLLGAQGALFSLWGTSVWRNSAYALLHALTGQ